MDTNELVLGVSIISMSSDPGTRERQLVVDIGTRLLDTGAGHTVHRGDSTYDRDSEYTDLFLEILHELFDHSTDVQSVRFILMNVRKTRLFINYTGPLATDEMMGRITKAASRQNVLIER